MLLILLFMLHLMPWYLSLIEGTITLSQISLFSDPSGIDRCFIHTVYRLLLSFGRYSCQFFCRNFILGYSLSLQKSLTFLTNINSSPDHPVLSRLVDLDVLRMLFIVVSNILMVRFNLVISFSFFLISFVSNPPCLLLSSSSFFLFLFIVP